MTFQLEVDPAPLLLAAAIYITYRLATSAFNKGSWLRNGFASSTSGPLIQVDASGENSAEPEPCAEPDESEDEQETARRQHPVIAPELQPPRVCGKQVRIGLAFGVLGACSAMIALRSEPVRALSLNLMNAVVPSAISIGAVANNAPVATFQPPKIVTMHLTLQRVPVHKNGNFLYHKNAYVGSLTAGTPSTAFNVVLDTGSGHLILPSSYCRSETCRAHRRYKRSASSSGIDYDFDGNVVPQGSPRDQITVNFGTGEVTGVFIEEQFCLQDVLGPERIGGGTPLNSSKGSGEECTRIRFVAATEMSQDPFQDFKFDGVLGLGMVGLSQGPQFHFLSTMAKTILHGSGDIFAMFIADGAAEQSRITFGGWDQDVLSGRQPRWVPVYQPKHGHWMVRLAGIRVSDANGTRKLPFCEDGGCRAVVDTGTSLLAVPSSSFSEMFVALKHPVPGSGSCVGNEGPQLHFDIDAGQYGLPGSQSDMNRVTLTLTPRDFARFDAGTVNQVKPAKASCKPMMMAMDLAAPLGPKLFILGEPVLKRFYTVFDSEAKRIGFGPARD